MKRREVIELARQIYDEDQLAELEHAIDYATDKHAGQKRKSGEPYISHPLAVAHTLIEWGMDIDSVLAGILHDSVEDTDATLEEIESLFSPLGSLKLLETCSILDDRFRNKGLTHLLEHVFLIVKN